MTFKSEAEQAIDDVEVVANRLREQMLREIEAAAGRPSIFMLVIACALCLLFGFIAGMIR